MRCVVLTVIATVTVIVLWSIQVDRRRYSVPLTVPFARRATFDPVPHLNGWEGWDQ